MIYSASLLPPAVNCGMLLSFPLYEHSFPQYVHGVGKPLYDEERILWMAVISLALTIENVIIIFVVARCMFWIKNVYIADDQNKDVWQSVTNFKHQYEQLKSKRSRYGIVPMLDEMNVNTKSNMDVVQEELKEESMDGVQANNNGTSSSHTEITNTNSKFRKGNKKRKVPVSIKKIDFEGYIESEQHSTLHNAILRQQSLRFKYTKSGSSSGSVVSSTFSPNRSNRSNKITPFHLDSGRNESKSVFKHQTIPSEDYLDSNNDATNVNKEKSK